MFKRAPRKTEKERFVWLVGDRAFMTLCGRITREGRKVRKDRKASKETKREETAEGR